MFRLVRKNDVGDSVVYPLKAGDNRIGRRADNDVVLDEPSVSKTHAVIVVDQKAVRIVDQQSTNGTLVNGSRVDEAELKIGDEVLLGEFRLRLAEGADPAAIEQTFIGSATGKPNK